MHFDAFTLTLITSLTSHSSLTIDRQFLLIPFDFVMDINIEEAGRLFDLADDDKNGKHIAVRTMTFYIVCNSVISLCA